MKFSHPQKYTEIPHNNIYYIYVTATYNIQQQYRAINRNTTMYYWTKNRISYCLRYYQI